MPPFFMPIRFFILFVFLLFSNQLKSAENLSNSANSSETSLIQHLEPPFWWVGMQNNQLQLMLHGKNIAEFEIKTQNKRWEIQSVERIDNSNYLFVNLNISTDANAGIVELQLIKNNQIFHTLHYQLNPRKQDSHLRQGFNSSDSIYLIMPDRFANGDYNNDQIPSLLEGVDRKNPDGRHGGDLQGIIDHLDYIVDMGFTQIWLNPVLENNQKKYSYHGYSATDFYQVDKRFGDNDLYKLLSQKAKKIGVGLIHDVVLNHIGSNHWWMKDLPSKDWVHHSGQFVATSHKRESLYDPYATLEDKKSFTDGWFVPSMPDLNQRNQLLANYLIQNSIWWIEFADLSGIRIDTFSYADKQFLVDYTRRIMQEYPNFNLVAEEWSINPNIVSYWQRGKQRHDSFDFQLPSLMDFPLQYALTKSLKEKESWSDGLHKLYSTLANDFIYADPNSLVIFADNHDMSRMFSQLKQDDKLTKLAFVFLATTRGIPQFFYGSEILMDNQGSTEHGIIRSDFPGGWQGDSRSAFSKKGLKTTQKLMQKFIRELFNWRKNTSVVHDGKLTHYAPKSGVYVYFRYNQSDKVMIVLNKNDQATTINPDDYPSMLSIEEKQKVGFDILTANKHPMNQSINVPAKTSLILQLQN